MTLKDVFGFKKNKCKVKLPDTYTTVLKVDNITPEQMESIPAGGNIYILIPIGLQFPEITDPDKWSVMLSFSNKTETSNYSEPPIFLYTARLINMANTVNVAISLYNPTSADVPLRTTGEKIHLILIENV